MRPALSQSQAILRSPEVSSSSSSAVSKDKENEKERERGTTGEGISVSGAAAAAVRPYFHPSSRHLRHSTRAFPLSMQRRWDKSTCIGKARRNSELTA